MSLATNCLYCSMTKPSYPLPGILKAKTAKRFVSMHLSGPIRADHQPSSPATLEFPVRAWFTKTTGA